MSRYKPGQMTDILGQSGIQGTGSTKECPHTLKKLPLPHFVRKGAASEYPIDPVERLWAEELDQLAAMGVPERQRRPMIGNGCATSETTPVDCLDAIRRAREFGTKDPISLISRLLNPVSAMTFGKTNLSVLQTPSTSGSCLPTRARSVIGDGMVRLLFALPSTGRS